MSAEFGGMDYGDQEQDGFFYCGKFIIDRAWREREQGPEGVIVRGHSL